MYVCVFTLCVECSSRKLHTVVYVNKKTIAPVPCMKLQSPFVRAIDPPPYSFSLFLSLSPSFVSSPTRRHPLLTLSPSHPLTLSPTIYLFI